MATFDEVFDPANEKHAEAFLYRTFEGEWPDWIKDEWKAAGYNSIPKDKDFARYMLVFHYIETAFPEMHERFNRRTDLLRDR